jgi:uncharacterized protein
MAIATVIQRVRRASAWRRMLCAALTLLALAAPAAAQNFPALTGRVVDQAGILDQSARAALTARLAALEAQNTDQLVVATVSSLQGDAIEDYAVQLFRTWRLGQAGKNNGVLLLVAPAERKVRIEVGYGLEGTLTDAVARLIIERSVAPRFRANDFAGGIAQATDDIVQVLTGDAAQWQRGAAGNGGIAITLPRWAFVLMVIVFCAPFLFFFGAMGWLVLGLILTPIVRLLVLLHLLPKQADRRRVWRWLNRFDDGTSLIGRLFVRKPALATASAPTGWSTSSDRSSDSSSFSSSDSFSGGGGSSGGGGASGSW